MKRLYQQQDDFEAMVRILEEKEVGRRTPLFNGIRWDLRYWHQSLEDGCSMVWPEFIEASGDMIPADLPVVGLVRARFYVIAPEMREFHRRQARPGIGLFCVEGARVCAAGVITKITGLVDDPAQQTKA
jgi:hypothetical protein